LTFFFVSLFRRATVLSLSEHHRMRLRPGKGAAAGGTGLRLGIAQPPIPGGNSPIRIWGRYFPPSEANGVIAAYNALPEATKQDILNFLRGL
jgi:hypothetical protein